MRRLLTATEWGLPLDRGQEVKGQGLGKGRRGSEKQSRTEAVKSFRWERPLLGRLQMQLLRAD